MLRRTGGFLALFSSAGGSAPRSKRPSSDAYTDAAAAESAAAAGVYLPWTARPWAVTYRVHYTQWKFVDTVFAHLATVAPAVLNDRAQEQGVRDVLCELEEPVVALRRQQARQARRLKRQEEALDTDATSSTSQMLTSAVQHTATTATMSPSATPSSGVTADDAAATQTSSTLDSLISKSNTSAEYEAVDSHIVLLNANKKMKDSRKSRKMKDTRKSKKAIHDSVASDVIIYEL
ncbi:hypothetical protein Q4I30_001991 [Leishmania utingensis]|uniref:Uncharacterized protein n=1 Tax=Leishmania utingensis TaxID=653362 RepID=A0AAW3ATZ6_9TRYP